MQRPIKFRAWVECDWYNLSLSPSYDGTQWKMAEVKALFTSTNKARLSIVNGIRKRSYDVEIDKIKLMQYTGLKDKNGVEIYEGDIVREVLWEQNQTEDVLGKVHWSEGNAGFWVSGRSVLTKGYSEDLEVIGNIYENPDLLTNKGDK